MDQNELPLGPVGSCYLHPEFDISGYG